MRKKTKKKNKKNYIGITFMITVFVTVTFSYLVNLIWKKLDELIGTAWVIVVIIGILILCLFAIGYFATKKINKRLW